MSSRSRNSLALSGRASSRSATPPSPFPSTAGRWPETRSTGTRSSRSSRSAIVFFCPGSVPRFLPRRLLRVVPARPFLDRHHDRLPLPAKPPQVQVLDQLRQRRLPRLLVVVVELPELPRVHPELPSHLHVRVQQVEAPSCLGPVLEVLRELLAHVGHPSPRH